MHAASREALAQVKQDLDSALNTAANSVAVSAQTGAELFDVVDVLDGDRGLRVAVADSSKEAPHRVGLIEGVFGGKVSATTLAVLKSAANLNWSTPREFRSGLVKLGRTALLTSAQKQGQLGQVEDELFRLSRILDREGKLVQLLSDGTQPASTRRDLLAKVLYGKVTAVTEALALQAVGRQENNPIDDVSALAADAAELQGRSVAYVVSAVELNDGQQQALAEKLGNIYGRAMSIHSEVDTSLLGGMVIRVGDEVIDGSTSGKLERIRANFA